MRYMFTKQRSLIYKGVSLDIWACHIWTWTLDVIEALLIDQVEVALLLNHYPYYFFLNFIEFPLFISQEM